MSVVDKQKLVQTIKRAAELHGVNTGNPENQLDDLHLAIDTLMQLLPDSLAGQAKQKLTTQLLDWAEAASEVYTKSSKFTLYRGWTLAFFGNDKQGGKAYDAKQQAHNLCIFCGHPHQAHVQSKCPANTPFYEKHDPRRLPRVGDQLRGPRGDVTVTGYDEERELVAYEVKLATGVVIPPKSISSQQWREEFHSYIGVHTQEDPIPAGAVEYVAAP